MQTLRLMSFAFWCGYVMNFGINMAYQDWLGLESYIAMLRERWIDFHWIVGTSVVLITMFVYMGRRVRVLNALEEKDGE